MSKRDPSKAEFEPGGFQYPNNWSSGAGEPIVKSAGEVSSVDPEAARLRREALGVISADEDVHSVPQVGSYTDDRGNTGFQGELQINEDPKSIIQREMARSKASREAFMATDPSPAVDRHFMDKSANALDEEHPVALLHMATNFWGQDWLDWEPETIIQTADMDGIELDAVMLNKLFAIRVVLKTEEFFEDPRVFEKVCIAFSDRIVDWGLLQEPRIPECAATVAIVNGHIKRGKFSERIAAYVAGIAVKDGYLILPPQLQFAEFPFSMQLAETIGDEILEIQDALMQAIHSENIDDVPEEYLTQYMRILKCEYHVQEMMSV